MPEIHLFSSSPESRGCAGYFIPQMASILDGQYHLFWGPIELAVPPASETNNIFDCTLARALAALHKQKNKRRMTKDR